MIEILYILIPSSLVLLTAYLTMSKLLRNEDKRRDAELRKTNAATITPIRLRAYERLTLVLERTSPNTLVINNIKPDMNCLDLQKTLLNSIRQEFGHNTSQQIYVSNELWNAIRSTQESLIRLVNSCATQTKPDSNAAELGERIIQVFASSEQTPTEISINLLKKEVRNLF